MAAPPIQALEPSSDEALVESLRRGGYTIYFRHAATEWSQIDRVSQPGDWKSCDPLRMRQLSNAGRDTAKQIGQAIRRLKIPIGAVLASEYCRTRQTARAMSLGPVSTTDAVINMRVADFVGGRDALVHRARQALSTPPRPGTNTVFVAHGNLVRSTTGDYPAEAGAVIYLPSGNGEVERVAQLTPEDWHRLAASFPSPSNTTDRDSP